MNEKYFKSIMDSIPVFDPDNFLVIDSEDDIMEGDLLDLTNALLAMADKINE